MSRIEELQEQIALLESELHDLQVVEWWEQRPHILEFRLTVNWESDDQGGQSAYFRPRDTELNYEWIAQNQEVWIAFCNHDERYPRPVEPDEDALSDDWDYYFRPVLDPEDWEYDYPNFEEFDEQIMVNPNFSSTFGGVCEF
jgi:hypothetical protein